MSATHVSHDSKDTESQLKADSQGEWDKPVTKHVEHISSLKPVKESEAISGTSHLLDQHGNVRLVPIPTDDPNDPLNMSSFRRALIVFTLSILGGEMLSATSGIPANIPVFAAIYLPQGITIGQVEKFGTYPSLFMGVGQFAFIPLLLVVGRRPMLIMGALLTTIAGIWCAANQSYESHLGGRILQGFASGFGEAMIPLIITDLAFVQHRQFWLGCYWFGINAWTMALSSSITYMTQAYGWRWCYGIYAIIAGITSIAVIFIVPETRYERPVANLDGKIVATDLYGETIVYTYEEAIAAGISEEDLAVSHTTSSHKKNSYLHDLKPFHGLSKGGWKVFPEAVVNLFISVSYPAILWNVLVLTLIISLTVMLSLTFATKLASPPWSWTAAETGLIQLTVGPAALVALVTSALGDKFVTYMSKRNGGLREPEFHLITYLLPTLAIIIGVMLFALAGNNPEKYGPGLYVAGFGIFQYGFIAYLIIATVFAVESFPAKAGPIIVVVSALRNILSFAITNQVQTLLAKYSYLVAHAILIGIFGGLALGAIPVFFYGKAWRARGGAGILYWISCLRGEKKL